MTLKLPYGNAEALFNLFNNEVLLNYPASIDDQLVLAHMVSIYKKLRSKWEGEKKKVYTLKVSIEEALAYRIYWRDNPLTEAYHYEWSFIITHCLQIDQELTNRRINNIPTYKFLN